MSVNEFDSTKPATSGTDASADLRNNYLALAQGADLLNVYASTPNDKKVHWKAANRAYIGATRLNVASGELNMTNFNSYIGTDGYWAKALICMNLSGEKDVRVSAQAQYSGETAMPTIPSYEIPMASVNFQRNGSSINNIANTNIDDMRPVVMGHDGATNATNAINATNATNLIGGISSLIRAEQSAENAGIITVTASTTLIAELPSMTVAVGDRIMIGVFLQIAKGATAGLTRIRTYKQSGTATIVFGNDYSEGDEALYQDASPIIPDFRFSATYIARVTVAGTLVLSFNAASGGSDGTVAAGAGQLYALVLKGS